MALWFVAVATIVSACAGEAVESTRTNGAPTAATTLPDTTTAEPASPGRVVVLGEEVLLADILALGIRPVASSATVDAVGFQGLDQYDTSNIEVLGMVTLSLEYLATLEPDVIVTFEFWQDQIGADVLEGMADVVAIPDGLSIEERIKAVAEAFDREHVAEGVTSDLTAAYEEAERAIPDDCEVSIATVYAGPSIAAFVAPTWEMPASIARTGCTLVPDESQGQPDQGGRIWISLEQLDLLSAPNIVMFQNETIDGEPESLDEIQGTEFWQRLPAVEAGNVFVFDRLGYPGAGGQTRFLEALVDALGA